MKKICLIALMGLLSSRVMAQKISEGSIVSVQLDQQIESKKASVGDLVELEVSEPYIVDDKVIIRKGTKVYGKVTHAVKPELRGKPGELGFSIDYLTLASGAIIKLRSDQLLKPETKFLKLTFTRGTNATYEKGKVFKAFVAQNYDL